MIDAMHEMEIDNAIARHDWDINPYHERIMGCDIQSRVRYLENFVPDASGFEVMPPLDDEEVRELSALKALLIELEQPFSELEIKDQIFLVRYDDRINYVMEWCDEMGYFKQQYPVPGAPWKTKEVDILEESEFLVMDWEATAHNFFASAEQVNFDGVTYYVMGV